MLSQLGTRPSVRSSLVSLLAAGLVNGPLFTPHTSCYHLASLLHICIRGVTKEVALPRRLDRFPAGESGAHHPQLVLLPCCFTSFTTAFISSRRFFEIWFDKDSGQCMATSSSFTSPNGPTRPDNFCSSRCWSAPRPSQIVA
jgi:hypothetical protein